MSDWKNTVSMISNKIKHQLHSRKTDHLDIVNQWIYKYDQQNTGQMPRYEFEQFLGKIGVFLTTQELRCLYDKYSVKSAENPKQLVNYADILDNIKVDISEYRLSIIKNAWQFLDSEQQGKISIQEICQRYQSAQHPRVRTREKSLQQVQQEFENAIVQKSADQQFITEKEFLQYYSDLNLTLQNEKDEYFADLVFKTWGITSGENYVSPQRLNDLQMILYEKIRQKTFTKTDEGLTAKKTFQHFDIADTGYINYQQFCQALTTFGCIFEERELQALFMKFDLDQSGRIDYKEFSKLFANLGSGFYANTNPIYDELRKVPRGALNKISEGLSKKGITKQQLQQKFEFLDSDQTGVLDREQFQSVLVKEGIILPKPDNDALYRHFDTEFKDQLPYYQIISALQ